MVRLWIFLTPHFLNSLLQSQAAVPGISKEPTSQVTARVRAAAARQGPRAADWGVGVCGDGCWPGFSRRGHFQVGVLCPLCSFCPPTCQVGKCSQGARRNLRSTCCVALGPCLVVSEPGVRVGRGEQRLGQRPRTLLCPWPVCLPSKGSALCSDFSGAFQTMLSSIPIWLRSLSV